MSNITDTEISFTAPSPHADTIWKVRSQIHLLRGRGLLSRVLTGGVAKLGRGISRLCCVVRSEHTGEYFAERSRRCSLRSPRRLHRVAGGVRVAGAGHLPRHEGRPPQLPWPLPLGPAGRQPRVEQRPRQEGGAVGPPAGQVGGC